ncbi:MAG TPA: VTT domain-containing protein [Edaphobacter sp.]|jgi:membrane protein DedA with SNARE-associated domain/rhodanese-related sulfurtransferase|nr:VTT domain-containing protein [Edaphobacter sp.]
MPIAIVFFVHYAYLLIFLWVLVEQIGIPIPSIPVLLTAGTLSATHRVSWIGITLSMLLACIIADTIWFALGRRYGNSVLKLLCRLSFEASTCVSKTEGYFTRRGAVTLLFAKFVPGLSTVAAPIAGQTGMSLPRFLAWDIAGSIIWGETFILAGRFFGDLAKKSVPFFQWLGHFAFYIFVVMVLGFLAHRIWKQRKFLQQVRELRLEPSELKEMLDESEKLGTPSPFIVDLRHPLDYLPDPRVLPGALRIGPNELRQHSEIIPRDRDVILYCTCPSEETSAKLALQLHKMGVYRVRPLRGGFDGWKQAGYPLVDYVTDSPSSEVVQKILRATPDTTNAVPLV